MLCANTKVSGVGRAAGIHLAALLLKSCIDCCYPDLAQLLCVLDFGDFEADVLNCICQVKVLLAFFFKNCLGFVDFLFSMEHAPLEILLLGACHSLEAVSLDLC